jgi:hypothetical protein
VVPAAGILDPIARRDHCAPRLDRDQSMTFLRVNLPSVHAQEHEAARRGSSPSLGFSTSDRVRVGSCRKRPWPTHRSSPRHARQLRVFQAPRNVAGLWPRANSRLTLPYWLEGPGHLNRSCGEGIGDCWRKGRPQAVGEMSTKWALTGHRERPRCPELGSRTAHYVDRDPNSIPGASTINSSSSLQISADGAAGPQPGSFWPPPGLLAACVAYKLRTS